MAHKLTRTLGLLLTLTVLAAAALAADPGIDLPNGSLAIKADSQPSDQKKGSFLIYNVYRSSASAANTTNTRINITNTHSTAKVAVHLFFVDGTSCSVADSFICLTPNQTAGFLASDVDPGTAGYILAVATDDLGVPIEFDWLIGDEFVKLESGHAANLGAIAVSVSISPLVVFNVANSGGSLVRLEFDGICYNRLPFVLAADNIPSRADANDTLFVINRIGGNYATGAGSAGTLFGVIYDDAETPFSFNISGACQISNSISDTFPRTVPRFSNIVPAGRSAWAKVWANTVADNTGIGGRVNELRSLTGAMINRNTGAGTTSNAFNGGHNLHTLTLNPFASLAVPVFPPGC